MRFAGMPFAKPPVGPLRFQPPQKYGGWEGTWDGRKQGPIPVQPLEMVQDFTELFSMPDEFGEGRAAVMDEDCLYVDVYTTTTDPQAKLPVLFWIYGGGFSVGHSLSYDGNVLASCKDVVVVVPNYRVNVFGFLSFTGGDQSPCRGNMGLLDQVMALEWCRDNVSSFGGDPEKVTISGESAGAISVGLHLTSPRSRGLFHRAISHSGVANFPMCVVENNDAAVKRLLADLNITGDDSKSLEQLKQKSADEIMKVYSNMIKEHMFVMVNKRDGSFLVDDPTVVMTSPATSSSCARVPYMLGVNNSEAMGVLAPGGKEKGFDGGLSEEAATEIMMGVVGMIAPEEKHALLRQAIIDEYGRGVAQDEMYWSQVVGDWIGDQMFLTASLGAADKWSGDGLDCYFYHMTHQTRYSHDPEYNLSSEQKYKSKICKCDHSDDIFYTFGFPLSNAEMSFPVRWSEEEVQLAQLWMSYVTNFVHTGDPNKGPSEVAKMWPRYDGRDRSYLEVGPSPAVKRDLKADRIKFFTETLPALLQK